MTSMITSTEKSRETCYAPKYYYIKRLLIEGTCPKRLPAKIEEILGEKLFSELSQLPIMQQIILNFYSNGLLENSCLFRLAERNSYIKVDKATKPYAMLYLLISRVSNTELDTEKKCPVPYFTKKYMENRNKYFKAFFGEFNRRNINNFIELEMHSQFRYFIGHLNNEQLNKFGKVLKEYFSKVSLNYRLFGRILNKHTLDSYSVQSIVRMAIKGHI